MTLENYLGKPWGELVSEDTNLHVFNKHLNYQSLQTVMENEKLSGSSINIKIVPKKNETDHPLLGEQSSGTAKPQKPGYVDVLPQILSSCVSLSAVLHAGISLAFSGVLIPQLEGTIEGFTKENASWIASIVVVAQPLGALFVGPLMDAIGRKKTCIITNIPLLIGWLVIYSTQNTLWPIYVGRLLCGFGSGMTTVGLVYTAEVSHSAYRPMLLSLNSVNVALGILLVTVMGVFIDWRTCSLLFAASVLVTLTMTFFIPESPHWLINFTKFPKERIIKEVRILNRPQWLFEEEWERLQQTNAIRRTSIEDGPIHAQSSNKFAAFFERSSLKPLNILFIIFFLQQASGTYVVIFYTVNIFRSIGGNFGYGFNEYTATMALGILRFIMSFVSAFLSKIAGRRPIMLVSSIGMGLSSIATAAFMQLNGITTVPFSNSNSSIAITNASVEAVASLPDHTLIISSSWILISILIFVGAGAVGHMVIPWTLISELLPTKIRASGSGLLVSYASLLLFIVIKTFPGLLDLTTLPIMFLFYGIMSLVSAVYVQLFLPETFRKNFNEIAQMFEKKTRDN